MKRLITVMLVLFALGTFVAPVVANGKGKGSDVINQPRCESMGGIWHKERGIKSCLTITEEGEVDFPRGAWEERDWEAILAFLERDPDDRTEETIGIYLLLLEGTSQRGNPGAFGTRDTAEPKITCKELGNIFLPQDICDFIERERPFN